MAVSSDAAMYSEFLAGQKPKYSTAERMSYRAGKAAAKGRKKAPAKKRATKKYSRARKGYGGGGRAVIYPNIVGYGDYVMNPEDAFGRRYGGLLGAKAGELLGGAAQSFLSGITGMGDYEVSKNCLMAPTLPVMINDSNKGGVLVRYQEYLGDVITSTTPGAFRIQNFPLNVGLDTTFPWLAQVASNYEQYSLEGVIFEFRSNASESQGTTTVGLGYVIMATEYDSQQPPFANKAEMENHEFGTSCKISKSMMHPIECAPRQTSITELYVRSGANPTGSDIRLYDWGRFSIATVGLQAASQNVGELHVTYQVRLLKPRMYASLGSFNGAFAAQNSGYANSVPFGTGTYTVVFDTIGISIDPPGSTISFPNVGLPQTYLIYIKWFGTGAAISVPTYTYTNCALNASYTPNLNPSPENGITAATFSNLFSVTTTGANLPPSIQLNNVPTLPSSGQLVYWRICQIDNAT